MFTLEILDHERSMILVCQNVVHVLHWKCIWTFNRFYNNDDQRLSFRPVSKARTNKFYICRQHTYSTVRDIA